MSFQSLKQKAKGALKGTPWLPFSLLLGLALVLFVIDLVSKQVVYGNLIDEYVTGEYITSEGISYSRSVGTYTAIPYLFNVTLAFNKGAAWSIGSGMTGFLAFISLFVGLLLIAGYVFFYKKMPMFVRVALVLAIAGDFGNMVDRIGCTFSLGIYERGVVDFISFAFWESFPIFNLADSYLVIAIAILIVGYGIMAIKTFLLKKNIKEENPQIEDSDDLKKKLAEKKENEDESLGV